MGTRCLTVIVDGDQQKEICVLYRQFDGYPSGHGEELKKFLTGFEIVNGFSERKPKLANGAACLAAQIVKQFKDDVGGFYLYAAGTRDVWEEYIYTVTAKASEPISIEVKGGDKVIYSGPVDSWDLDAEEIEEGGAA